MTSASRYEPKRVTFAYFPERLEEGAEFESWPRHLTLFPPVKVAPLVAESVAERVAKSAYEFPIVLVGQDVFDGERVHLLEAKRSAVMANMLHMRILDGLSRHVDLSDQPDIGKDRIPHITQKEGQPALADGDRFTLDHIAVLTRDINADGEPQGAQRVSRVHNLNRRG